VIDLDRARLHASAVGLGPRRRSLRRLERSYAKRFGSRGALGAADWTVLRHVYARGDARLGERLVRWRQLDRLGIAAHRLGGWR
jgi:hypothetical protein